MKYDKDCAIHFQSINGKTVINKIDNKEKDFKTSYEALWDELNILYMFYSNQCVHFNLISSFSYL